jgi:hypothetical protein
MQPVITAINVTSRVVVAIRRIVVLLDDSGANRGSRAKVLRINADRP